MKTSYKLLSVLAISALSACSKGTVSGKSSVSSSSQTAVPSPTVGYINVGNVPVGVSLQVEQNPSPVATPAPTVVAPAEVSQVTFGASMVLSKLISLIIPDAKAVADSYVINDYASYVGQLQSVLGSEFLSLQNQYNNYAAMVASNPSTPVPAALQQIAHLQFTSANMVVSHLYAPLVKLLNPKFAIISLGADAWGGYGYINGANSGVQGGLLKDLVDGAFIKTGANVIKVVGGKFVTGTGTFLNRNYATITLTPGEFSISTSASAFPSSTSYVGLRAKAVSSTVVSAFALSATAYQGKHIFVAMLNSANKIVGFYGLNIATGVITTLSGSCNSTKATLFGLTCNTSIVVSLPSETFAPAPATSISTATATATSFSE